ncbi:MAG: class I SAM-dependent methyltransferase [candidate division Zixibacteria bacterium]|nr:class I SAM-dependent methyltransferase [candidate division Zixibacteria bacterium]
MTDPRLIRYYRARACEYEEIYYRDKPARRAELAAETNRLQQLVADRSILDVPCGTGYWLERMSQTATDIVAVDITLEMINQARTKKCECPVAFVLSDLYNLPLADNGFDVVALGFWFSHHPKQAYDVLFDAITPQLKAGGRIWMIDNNPPAEGSQLRSAGTDKHGNNYTLRHLKNGTEFAILKNYFDQDQLQEAFLPRFHIERLMYGTNYWSVVLKPR